MEAITSDEAVKDERDNLVEYVRDMVADAVRNGKVEPGIGLECFLYALDKDLVAALREFAALDPLVRSELLTRARLIATAEPRCTTQHGPLQ